MKEKQNKNTIIIIEAHGEKTWLWVSGNESVGRPMCLYSPVGAKKA